MPHVLRHGGSRTAAYVATYVVVAALAAPACASAQLRRAMPAAFSDAEFWQFFTTMSEAGGSFLSENFVSNEQTYQHVIPTLQKTLTPRGVYLGVGPEQNFTYIAALQPRLAVIFDIRRQNAMAHLMYKALFELAPTRADFVSMLFSRPLPASLGTQVGALELFAAVNAAAATDSAFEANRAALMDRLMVKHGFGLSADDTASITHVYRAFHDGGPGISYAYRSGARAYSQIDFGTYAQLQTQTNAAGVNMAFLATEENYQRLRAMQLENLVIPVVADFAGPTAIRHVGEYLRQRGATVTAFYLSNVEQYLFPGPGGSDRFYRNVETLPLDSTSTFIRSVPLNGGAAFGSMLSVNGALTISGNYYSVQIVDSAGQRTIVTNVDSAGRRYTTRTVDTTRAGISPLQVFRSLRARDDSLVRRRLDSTFRDFRSVVMGGSGLVSGIAPIRSSLEAFLAGKLQSYADAIAMTKIDGWK